MKLYTFEVNKQRRLGAEWSGQMVDLPIAYDAYLSSLDRPQPGQLRAIPNEMLSFVRLGSLALDAAGATLAYVQKRPAVPVGEQLFYPFDTIQILAPLERPGKILCTGNNFRAHLAENPRATLPTEPFFFAKLPSTIIAPGQPIVKPRLTEQLDFEVELAVIIGRRIRHITADDVPAAIFGYTILHDVSARDVQFKDHQITLGKNFDTFCPLGPCITTADEIANPGDVPLRSYLNGTLMQSSSTADWIFPLPQLISALSQVMTLEPGDIVSTGTPAGVGVFRQPPVFMQPGDTVALEIDGIGRLENPVAADPA